MNSSQIQEYVQEYNEYREPDFQPELILLPSQVQHIYWTIKKFEPDEPECDCEIFVRVQADTPGANAVTVVDV